MAHMINDLAKFFTWDDINIDNWNFKLFHKGNALFFFGGSLVGVMSQYFGEPINCDFKGLEGELASDYCWIHGSSFIKPEYQTHMKCIVDLEGIDSEDDAPDTSYYQWVTFMMLFQAGITLLPHKIWNLIEGGLIASFGSEGKASIMLYDHSKMEEESVVMEKVVQKFVNYFRAIFHHNNLYFFQFFCCELLNYLILLFNFWATDLFLQGKFRYYGWNVLQYYLMTKAERENSINPFCQTFPTEVSCTVPNIGAAGGEQFHNGLCVLSQNIINEKVYLALWFWLVFVMILSIMYFLFRICTICFDGLRVLLLRSRVYHRYDPEILVALDYVMAKSYIGDWFVLHQLGKNVNRFFYREFIKELCKELKARPKRSLSLDKTLRKRKSTEDDKKVESSSLLNNA
ncbi:innexin inx2 [Lepeophtheirus salmonis]|uniref:innexin inx2 n=1 Tax=Lepeophtheirus salmonis TaxID=72036 RepID=UPI001AE40791|nr:innexin inx2-like [Lepeophtheirus salmonis]